MQPNPASQFMSFDRRHLVPMSVEFAQLCWGSLTRPRFREELVNVGRSVRNAHLQAADTFRSLPFTEVIRRLSDGQQPPTHLPPVDRLYGNTIGHIIPYWYLGALAAAKRPKTVFEIGTYLGASALTFALNTDPDCSIITVDLPEEADLPETRGLTAGDQELVHRAASRVGSAFIGHPLAARITQVRASSDSMRATDYLPAGRKVDLFFIDGGHSYDLVAKDTETAFGVIAPDGLVVWDDYNWIFPELRRFLWSTAASHPLVRIEGTQYVVCHQALA